MGKTIINLNKQNNRNRILNHVLNTIYYYYYLVKILSFNSETIIKPIQLLFDREIILKPIIM